LEHPHQELPKFRPGSHAFDYPDGQSRIGSSPDDVSRSAEIFGEFFKRYFGGSIPAGFDNGAWIGGADSGFSRSSDFPGIQKEFPNKDFYAILGVKRGATQAEIKVAFRKMAYKWHPDKNQNNQVATEKFQDINEAHRILSNPDMRTRYDREQPAAGAG
jgi:hypothetical protein